VSGDADKLLELVNGLAAKQSDKVEVDEALLLKFASGAYDVSRVVLCRQCSLAGVGKGRKYLQVTGCCTSCRTLQHLLPAGCMYPAVRSLAALENKPTYTLT
jgi:hypothetical protein